GVEDSCRDDDQRRARRISVRGVADAAERAQRRGRPHRHQGRLLDGRLRCVFNPAGRPAGSFASGARRRSAGTDGDDDRRYRAERQAASGSAAVPGTRGVAVWHLHPRLHRRLEGVARRQPESDGNRSSLLPGRQSVPLHRLRQNHSCRARRGRGDAEGNRMSTRHHFDYVGTRPIRHDGMDKVTGRAAFAADFSLPGMLHGVVIRSPHAHARIVSIDTSAAEAVPGVKAVVTGSDMPRTNKKVYLGGEGALDLGDMGDNAMAHEKALYNGHAVAAVAASTLDIAREAARLVRVDYEVLEPAMSLERALAKDAPILHRDMTTGGKPLEHMTGPTNIA